MYHVADSTAENDERLAEIFFRAKYRRGEKTALCTQRNMNEQKANFEHYRMDPRTTLIRAVWREKKIHDPSAIHGLLGYTRHSPHVVEIDYFYTLPFQDKKPGSALMRHFLQSLHDCEQPQRAIVKSTSHAEPVYERFGYVKKDGYYIYQTARQPAFA